MRDFQARIARRDAIDFAPDPAKSLDDFIFATAFGKKLHADANAEKRPPFAAHRLFERLDHAGDGVEAAAAIGESAHARQYHTIGACDEVRIARHRDRLLEA